MRLAKYERPPVRPDGNKPAGGKHSKAMTEETLIEEILKAAGLERLD